MSELQRFVWEWPNVIEQFQGLNPSIGNRLSRACRPIGADRRPDGRLLLVLGCWVAADRAFLEDTDVSHLIERGLKQVLEERIDVLVAPWPAGDGEPDAPPDPLANLPEAARATGLASGGAIKRAFFAAAYQRGMEFETGYPVLQYRLDFALPSERVGVEIEGWDWRARMRPGADVHREREQTLGFEGWTIFWFSGEDMLKRLDRSVNEVAQVVTRRRQGRAQGPPLYRAPRLD
jgi:very-short-patch-repair endonuclease